MPLRTVWYHTAGAGCPAVAAAATAVVPLPAGEGQLLQVRIEHPFVLLLRDNRTSAVLAAGRIIDLRASHPPWRSPMDYVHVNGIDLAYHTEGSGLPYLVPRPANTSMMERTLSAHLREHLQLIFFDFRSSGRSSGVPGDFTLDQLIDDIEQVRQALGCDTVALLGWSMLGLFALDVAKAYPASLSHLILIGTPIHLGATDDRYWQLHASAERKAILAANHARLDPAALTTLPAGQVMPLQYVANGPIYWYDASFNCRPLYGDDPWDTTFYDRFAPELARRHGDALGIQGITTPIFFAQGVWDFGVWTTDWYDVIQTYPNCTYHAFERSGHYPFYEEQELFDAKLIAWLAERGAGG